jgi:hypothetical protein
MSCLIAESLLNTLIFSKNLPLGFVTGPKIDAFLVLLIATSDRVLDIAALEVTKSAEAASTNL